MSNSPSRCGAGCIAQLLLGGLLTAFGVQGDAQPPRRALLNEMLQQHPQIKSAQQQIEAARQDTEGARWQYFPTPSIGLENSNQTSAFTDSKTRFVRLQQPLWTGGRLSAQTDRAQAQEALMQASWEEQRHNLAIRWLELWADAGAARQRITAYAVSEQEHQRYVQLVRARASEGQIARSEVQLSLTRLASVQADLEQAWTQYRQGLSKLQQMLGRAWPQDLDLALPELPLAPLEPGELTQQQALAQEGHPLILKNLALTRSVRAEVELTRSRLAPELYARAEIVRGDVTGEVKKTYIGFSSSWGGGLSVLNAVGAAQNRLSAQEEDLQARRRDLQDIVASDHLQWHSQTLRYGQLQQALEASEAYLQSSESQFAAGRRSWQDLMNSAREKAQLRAQLADTMAQAWLSRERLQLNTHGLQAYLGEHDR